MRTGKLARVGAPVVVIAILVASMNGCLYVPTGECPYLADGSKDFRGMTGPGRPIARGRIDRAGVQALLGPPP